MAKYRTGRLGEEIKKTVSSFLVSEAKDPRLSSRIISISGVDVSRDSSYATIFVSPLCLEGEDQASVYNEVLEALNKAKGFIRTKVAGNIKIRHTPELIFKIDTSTDYGRRIDSILETLDINHGEDDE